MAARSIPANWRDNYPVACVMCGAPLVQECPSRARRFCSRRCCLRVVQPLSVEKVNAETNRRVIEGDNCKRCGSRLKVQVLASGGRQFKCRKCLRDVYRKDAPLKQQRWASALTERRHRVSDEIRRARGRAAHAKFQARFPEKYNARNLLRYAVKKGRIVRPSTCESCATASRLQAHHHDYSKPYEVEWLCTRCHGLRHRVAD